MDDAEGDDDRILVERARRDPHDFAPLYDRYVGRVYGYCYRRLGEVEAAEDATSLIFARALAALPRFTTEGATFRAWLFTIAHHTIVDSLRARRQEQPLSAALTVADPRTAPEEEALSAEEGRALRALLSALTVEQAQIVELRVAGLTDAEIAVVRAMQMESVRLFRESDDRWGLAMALYNLGDAYCCLTPDDPADLQTAGACYAESLDHFRQLGDAWGEALVLTSAGNEALNAGDLATARQQLERGLAILREVGDTWRVAQALMYLGQLELESGNASAAADLFAEAAGLYRRLGHRDGLAITRERLVNVAKRCGQPALADQLVREAAALQRDLAPAADADAAAPGADAAASRPVLPPSAGPPSAALSPREREVLRLVAAGHSNAEIAKALFISPRTASTHAAHILHKLDLASRAELIAYAHRQGLA
jgi:RNA polymerase sigma-70 factor (ECF subfamily)